MDRPTTSDKVLTERLDRLARELELGDDQPQSVDETSYFRLVDLAAADPETEPRLLDEAGNRFAQHFVAPYLHASDPTDLLAEIGALFAIHHRGSIHIESVRETGGGTEAVVTFSCITDDGDPAAPNRFDIAVLRHALEVRTIDATLEQLEADERSACRLRVLLPRQS